MFLGRGNALYLPNTEQGDHKGSPLQNLNVFLNSYSSATNFSGGLAFTGGEVFFQPACPPDYSAVLFDKTLRIFLYTTSL
jgi:hypothetical protein